MRRLQEIDTNLLGPYKPALISGKNYVASLLDKYTYKSWIIFLRIKDQFFNSFKFWLPRAETCENKLNYL